MFVGPLFCSCVTMYSGCYVTLDCLSLFAVRVEVTILSLDEDAAKSARALGILSSEARTFVQGGVTTEYTTQILGTTLGTTYARLLSTGSRVLYDNSRPASRVKPADAFLVFPTILQKSEPQQTYENTLEDEKRMKDIINGHETYNRLALDELFDISDTKNVQKVVPPTADERENVVSVRKEYSVKRNSEIKPDKVKGNNGLPTFTVSHDFAPSGFSFDAPEEKKEEIHKPGRRNGKALFRGGIPVKQEKKLDTVTYFGFADFTTTVGDTVIVFMPKTPDVPLGAVTSIQGEATLRPEDEAMPVVTSVKTFMSHSPGMATKTITGHSLSMRTSLPTIVADPVVVRESKAYEPIYVAPNRFGGFVEPSVDFIHPSDDLASTDSKSEVSATEPLKFSTATTQIYNSAENALGLVKSIGGTEAYDGTTTVFTSFVVGTLIDGAYQQLTQSASSVYINVNGEIITTTGVGINIAPSSASGIVKSVDPEGTSEIHTTEENEITTEGIEGSTSSGSHIIFPDETTSDNELSNEVDQKTPIESSGKDQVILHNSFILPQSSTDYITRIVPSTVYKTFTYLTTFFIPDDKGGQTTSIRSREVTSEDVSYVTKTISTNEDESTITPSEATTEAIPSTTPQEPTTMTEEARTEGTTPQIPVTSPDIITTNQPITTTELEEEEEKTTPSPTTPRLQDEEEVDLIFKTLYTTYTYLTTFFQESSTSVSSREVVVTNVITTTLDNSLATNPAIAGLFITPSASNVLESAPTSVGIGRPTTKYFEDSLNHDDLFSSTLESVDLEKELQTATPALDIVNEINENGLKTFYTTYTYFTTVFVDGETEVESRTEVYTNIVNPNSLVTEIKSTSQVTQLFSSDYVSVLPDEQVESPEDFSETNHIIPKKTGPTKLYDSTISRQKIKENEISPISEVLAMSDHEIHPTNINAYKYDTTMTRSHSAENTQTVNEQEVMEAKQKELSKEEKLLLGINPLEDPDVEQKIVVDVTSSSSGGKITYIRDSYDDPDDQITSESNTEEIEPSFSPTILLQTSYTTFTYFTTVYKGTTSDVISRLDTVTNVVTETFKPSEIEASLSPEEATLPITYFTTFTYWTTLYKDGSTMVTSREETISNIVTPTVSDTLATESMDITPTVTTKLVLPSVLTSVVGENAVDSHLEAKQLDSGFTESTMDKEVITPSPALAEEDKKDDSTSGENSKSSIADLEPTTYYTTYTYFTTSYIGNSTVLNSRLETVTNIVTPSAEATGSLDSADLNNDLNATKKIEGPVLKPTGLISTIRTSEVNDGTTTLLSTDVFGTYIDGLYAQILESSTQVVTPDISPVSTVAIASDNQPTGVVSINEGKIVDANGISTTFYTTKAVGTYIDKLYAQVIESTTSIQVDEDKKTATSLLEPSTTVVGSKTYRTGLVRLIEGSIIKDKTTTFYESRVIGTLIEGRYAQIIESTSSFKVEMTPTAASGIAATSVDGLGIVSTATVSSSPSPAVIESSIGEGEDDHEDQDSEEDDEEGGKGKSKSRLSFSPRKKTFTPVIRPFASRPRPTFLPKKKTGDVGSATTITRNAFTPTVTATPAIKSTSGFGSSRNRFAGGRRSSSSNVVQATASSSSGRRFSGGRRGSSTASISPVSSSAFRGRSSARVAPLASSAFGSSSRRGNFNYRTSSGARSSSVLPGSSRFRIRPTQSPGRPLQTVASTTEDILNTNDIGAITVVTEETLSTILDEEQETSPPTTTTESARRNNNPLLRFRRPPILQRSSTTTTTPKPSTTPARRSNLLRRPDSRGTVTTPTTPTRNKPSPTFPPRNRQRTSNNLFPPRSFFRKPTPAEEAEEEENKEDKDDNQNVKLDEENEFSDNDYEGSEHSEAQHSSNETSTTTESTRPSRGGRLLNNPVQIRPFRRPGARTKRQAVEWGARSYRSRYQRPTSRPASYDYYYEDSEPLPSEIPTTRTSRFKPRSRELTQTSQQNQNTQHSQQHSQHNQYNQQQHNQHNQHQSRVRPTKASVTTERAQFTLRDKSSSQNTRTSNFKRPTSRRRPTSIETTTVSQRPKPPRLRTQNTYNQQQQDTTHSSRSSGRRYSSSRRTPSRSRYRDSTDDSYSYLQSSFDGTITVTHQVPTEVTIPVVNGKVTEYKNVITAKPSLEVLGPHQYTTTTGKIGNVLIQLTSEITSTLPNGAMEITKFLVYETPTTSITFTPTTLRGRKTSFSHIVPSTVYDVKQEVSTVQPQIAPNAPLANLLLSQLLLGNLNLQPNPQQINPLLGLQNQQLAPATPTTEFKTKTTTYVTTVTDHTSTVLPLTFRGKEILTTIVDSSTQVITATEYLTETIVITPSAPVAANPQHINTLLLPALLQAQLLQSPQQPMVNPLLGLQPQILPQDILNVQEERPLFEEQSERFIKRKPIEDEEERPLNEPEPEDIIEQPKPEVKARKKSKKGGNKKPPETPPIAETSVVTLYVSGRKPGDFSTILSTVTLGEESTVAVRKREAQYVYDQMDNYKVESSKLPELGSSFSVDNSFVDYYVMSAMNEVAIEGSELETQSLESIVGDVTKYLTPENTKFKTEYLNDNTSIMKEGLSTDKLLHKTKSTKKVTGHFLSKSPAELAPNQRKGIKSLQWSNKSVKNTDDSIFFNEPKSMRVKRQTEEPTIEQLKRRRVKVRVPVQKRVNIDEELEPSEAQRSHDITHQELLQTQTTDFGTRKVKVIRKKPKTQNSDFAQEHQIQYKSEEDSPEPTPGRRRVAVRRRRPVNSVVYESYFSAPVSKPNPVEYNPYIQPSETFNQDHPELYQTETSQPNHRRKKVLVTRKRPISSSVTETAPTTRRKVLVARRKPVDKTEEPIEPATIFSNFFLGLHTDYDYESATINSELDETNDESNYEDVPDTTTPPSIVSVKEDEPDIDNIRVPSWVPEDHPAFIPFESSRVENSAIPESIVWFYQPSDEVLIDVTSSLNENPVTETKLPDEEKKHVQSEVETNENTSETQPRGSLFNLNNENKEMHKGLTEEDINVTVSSNNDARKPNTSEIELDRSPPIYAEEPPEFENAPKFVRPTRFSVTKKPSRTLTGYSGARRRQSTKLVSTALDSADDFSPTPSYKVRKQSKKYASTSSEIASTTTQETLNTIQFEKEKDFLPSEESITPSLSDEPEDLSTLTTPALQDSSISPEPSGEPEVSTAEPTSFITTVVTSTRLRTYTYLVTRVNGDESITTSSTSVKPATKTLTLTIPVLAYSQSGEA